MAPDDPAKAVDRVRLVAGMVARSYSSENYGSRGRLGVDSAFRVGRALVIGLVRRLNTGLARWRITWLIARLNRGFFTWLASGLTRWVINRLTGGLDKRLC